MENINLESLLDKHIGFETESITNEELYNSAIKAMRDLSEKLIELALENVSKACSENSDLIYDNCEIYKHYVSETIKQVE